MSEPKSIGVPDENLPAKVCTICNQSKPAEQFSRVRKSQERRSPYCKSCSQLVQRKWREANPEKMKAINARRNMPGGRKRSNWKPNAEQRARDQARKRKWDRNNQEKCRAQQAVNRAIKMGTLVRPRECNKCGKVARIQASHTDYSKQLDVEWLCPSCHKRKDNAIRAESLAISRATA